MTGRSLVHFLCAVPVLIGLLASPANAQGVTVKVHWTQDKLTSPPASSCSSSGAVGGTIGLHVAFQAPSNLYGAKVKELRVHEEAAHYGDLVSHDQSFTGQPHIACGDPYSAPGMMYFDAGLRSPDSHNGQHTITAIVEYIVLIPPPDQYHQPTQETRTSTATISVDFQNILITGTTPADPAPILWDPETMSSVLLSATVSVAYRANHPVTLTLYGSDQSPIKTLQQTVPLGPGSTTLNFPWDGTSDGYPPGPAPKGVYVFKWKVGDTYGSGDQDTEKSSYLSITGTRSELTEDYDEATDQNTARDGAVLTDSAIPRADAVEAQVRVYRVQEGELAVIAGPVALPVATNSPGEATPVWSEATFPLAIHEEEAHLFAARDDHAARDKGHRTRWALQNNQKKQRPRADCFAVIFGSADQPAAQRLRKMGYVAYAKGAQSAPTIYELLQRDTVMFYSGGGAYDSTGILDFYGGVAGTGNSALLGHRTATVPSEWPNLTLKFVGDLAAGKLSSMKLAVWLACLTATNGTKNNPLEGDFRTGNVVDEAVAKGATASLGFTDTITADVYSTWAITFFDRLKAGMTVREAAIEATAAASPQGQLDYRSFRIAGSDTTRLP